MTAKGGFATVRLRSSVLQQRTSRSEQTSGRGRCETVVVSRVRFSLEYMLTVIRWPGLAGAILEPNIQ